MKRSWMVPVMIGLAASALVVTGGSAGAAPPQASGAGASPAHRACQPRPVGQVVTLRNADNQRSVCVHRGDRIEVVLQVDPADAPAPEQWWQGVEVTGTALTALPNTMMPTRGTTLAHFMATTRGRATLSSSRRPCAPPRPGGYSCLMIEEWSVTVTVR